MKQSLTITPSSEISFEPSYNSYYAFRRSEVLGLSWSAIDFEHKTIAVNHKVLVVDKKVELSDTLKTKTSRRSFPLFPAIEKLLLEKKAQIDESKQFYGKCYNKTYLDYVFVDDTGKLIYPDVVTNNFAKILKQNNLKHIRFHDLRHSCASIMLASGVQMKQIQDWLGHSTFNTTADVYSHLDFSAKIQSANMIAIALEPQNNFEKNQSPAQESSKEILKGMLKEMTDLGFSSVTEYFDYLDGQSEPQEKAKKDFEM